VAKLVARTHANCVAEAENFVATTGIGPDDAIMVVVPLFHAHGLGNCLLASACGGARLVILTDAQPFVLHRRRTVELMAREGVTVLPGVPLLFEALAAMPRDEGTGGLEGEAPPSGPGSVTAPLGRLRLAFSAGSPLPGATARAFRDRWGVPLRQLYGCTEAGSVTIDLDADPSPERTGVGRPMRGVEVLAVDEKGEPLPPDAVGRVVIRSPALTRGYVGDPETTARSFRHGGFLTGDLGRVDAQGRLHVVGRVRPFIERAGHKVDPREVEAALLEHPEVREAVVLGVRRRGAGANEVDPATSPGDPTSPGDVGPGTGEAVLKAVVVAAGGLTEDELLRHCRARLAGFKVPSVVEIRDALPRDALGKVARRELT
jgi:long-chain acyl-CoA synthetase